MGSTKDLECRYDYSGMNGGRPDAIPPRAAAHFIGMCNTSKLEQAQVISWLIVDGDLCA